MATTAVGAMALVELHLPTGPYEAGVLHYLGEHAKTFEEIRIAAAGLEALGKQPPEATGWLKRIEKERNKDGTFGGPGDARACRRRNRHRPPRAWAERSSTRPVLIAALDSCQQPSERAPLVQGPSEGPSDLESTYRVVRCYHMMKARPDAARLLAFVDKCRNADGGYGVTPGQPSSVSGCYYAGIIRHWLGER